MKYLWLLISAFFVAGCGESIRGTGDIVEENRDISNFQSLLTEGSINVKIIPGDRYALKIVGDDNIIPYVVTEIREDELSIHYQDRVSISNAHTHVEVTVPFLNKIKTSGSGDISSEGTITNNKMIEISSAGSGDIQLSVNSPAVKIVGAGSGDFELSGETRDLNYSGSGSGDLNCRALKAENAKISIRGSGNVNVFASNTLSANIAGSGNVFYWGNPSLQSVNVAGSGKMRAGE